MACCDLVNTLNASSIHAKKTDSCCKESLQKENKFNASKASIHSQLQKILEWGSAAILVCTAAWCVAHLSSLSSYDRDSLLDIWNEHKMTSEQKLNLVWQMMISNQEPEPWPSLLEQMTRFFVIQTDDVSRLKLQQTFRPFGNKKKVIHTQSAYGRIRWKGIHNPMGYTGLFTEEHVDGVISFSFAPNSLTGTFSSNCGANVKLLRDYAPPSGFVAMFPLPVYKLFAPLSAQWNLFGTGPFCTHVSLLGGLGLLIGARQRPPTIPPKFVFKYPSKIGLLNLGNATKSGVPVKYPHIPYSICLRPNPELTERFKYQLPWSHPVEMLRKLPPGKLLFDVIAIDNPKALLDFPYINKHTTKVAEIWSISEFVSSKWGDQNWFGHHQDWSLDLESRPDWKPYMKLRTLLLEGWAYMPISPPMGPTIQQLQHTWFPIFATAYQLITNPKYFGQFLCIEVGLCRLSELVINSISAHNFPRGSQDRSKIYGHGIETNKTGVGDLAIHIVEPSTEKIEDYSESITEQLEDYNITELRTGGDTLEKAWQEFVNEWFSTPGLTGSTAGNTNTLPTPFLSASSSTFEYFTLGNENQLVRNMHPEFAVQGHYLFPTTVLGLRHLISNSSISAVVTAAVQHLVEPYNCNLSSSDVVIIIEEFINFFSDPLQVSKFFEKLPGVNSPMTV